jgi:predicted small lipoprotein YifL
MRFFSSLILAVAALGLAACMSATPLALPDDHPASPMAASGGVDTATAIANYKGADDFAARALAETHSGGHDGMQHGSMPSGGMSGESGMQHGGMQHGDMQGMAGMQHGGAPHGAGSR